VLKIVPQTDAHLALLHSWTDLDFWLEPSHVGREVHVMVNSRSHSFVRAKLLKNDLIYTVHVADVQKQIDEERAIIELRANRPETMVWNYNQYNTYADFLAEMTNLANNFCPNGYTCSTENIGQTEEGNDLRVLKLLRNNPPQPRYAIWYDSNIHAREWLAGATLMKIVERIFKGTDADAVHFRESYDWYFLPNMNPDGYLYTWATNGDRLWRKNRAPTRGTCLGTDLNRNYPTGWGTGGSSNVPCDETYMGDSSGSELETQAVNAYAARIRGNLVCWINFHMYGNYWLTPYGTQSGVTCDAPADYNSHQLPVANAAAEAIEATFGTTWSRGSVCTTIYEASGGLLDHMKSAHGIRWPHTPEMRGNSFITSEDQILPSYQEVWNGCVAKIQEMESIGLP